MSEGSPTVSVVIPVYNQSEYLSVAIESVLAQTYRDFEIVVVDDGSTDEAPMVARRFGEVVRYVRQENRGLAAARNTGIRETRSEYVALLDCDDEWLPAYLQTIMSLALQHPEADVYYCGWRYIDCEGRELPQSPGVRVVAPEALYEAMLRANFLMPSTVVMRRSAVVSVGLFDPSLRRLEDWDLWLRLLRLGHTFVGVADCLVRYRLHSSSLSVDRGEMHRSMLSVIAKLFGPDDGQWKDWSEQKRLVYGGAHRYRALTALSRGGDWDESGLYLRRALQVDPTLAVDLDLFYELALGAQPLGYRGTPHCLDIEGNARRIQHALDEGSDSPSGSASPRPQALGTAYYALGLVAYNTGRFSQCRQFLLTSLRFRPELGTDRRFLSTVAKSTLGRSNLDRLRLLNRVQGLHVLQSTLARKPR